MREILKNLYGITEPDGLTEEEFAFLENKFGNVPEKLRGFYSLCGHCENVLFVQDEWITPESYKKYGWIDDTAKGNMILLHENQGVCDAVIFREDLGKDDPPVYVISDNGDEPLLCAKSTEEFIKAALVYQGVFGFNFIPEAFFYISDDEFELLKEKLELMPYHLENWLFIDNIRLFRYSADGALFLIGSEGEYQMSYGAASEETFEKLSALLNGIGEEM